jgi:hypothetical protein
MELKPFKRGVYSGRDFEFTMRFDVTVSATEPPFSSAGAFHNHGSTILVTNHGERDPFRDQLHAVHKLEKRLLKYFARNHEFEPQHGDVISIYARGQVSRNRDTDSDVDRLIYLERCDAILYRNGAIVEELPLT